ncbi:Glycosyl transferase family 29 protein [Klebsormidium nitens]|uniref:Glycosyl transferase family 29 protein n=1 Tax=Klebsormidium nitens TaxID=105231 RepID=A0A1Y1I7W3_KLENI|nr:Glycosyl transferase family 29 protein [Klebsormidium nitens]|eukprot:GAQ84776.1 Glycosyl transferase family 29 protein [Klebsormidium nitens]
MAKLAPACTTLSARPAMLALLLCMAGSVYLLQLELPQDSASLDDALHDAHSHANKGYGVAAAGLLPRRGTRGVASRDCRQSRDRSSCSGEHYGESREEELLEASVEPGHLRAGQDGITASSGSGQETGDSSKFGEGPAAASHAGRQAQGAAPLWLREPGRKGGSVTGSATSGHQQRAQTDGIGKVHGRASQKSTGVHVGSEAVGSTVVGPTGEQNQVTRKEATTESGPAAQSSRGRSIRGLQAQVQQCIVERGGGLRAEAVLGDPCKVRVMHPPGVAATWADSSGAQKDAREVELDVCAVARYWAVLRNSSLVLTKEYLDAHNATAAVMHRMRRHKSDPDSWCRPKRCLHILRSQLPDRPPLPPGYFPRCAVVGNSADLLHTRFGPEIDGHDAVFRMNAAPTRGFTAHVGATTTFRVVNNRAWAVGLGAVSESAAEVLVAHGLFHPDIFQELRYGLPRKNNATSGFAQEEEEGESRGGKEGAGGNGTSLDDDLRDENAFGSNLNRSLGKQSMRLGRNGTRNGGTTGEKSGGLESDGEESGPGEWGPPLANPVLFLDGAAAGAGAAEGTGFRALQLAASVCGAVSLYGFSVDVGYARWGKYFTARDGPGHAPLRGVMYYQALECLGVVSLHSAARSSRSHVAPPPPLLADVLAAVQSAEISRPPSSCSRWAAAFTPRSRTRTSCNSPVALPLKPAAMRAAKFDVIAGLHVHAGNMSGLLRPLREDNGASVTRSASMQEAIHSAALDDALTDLIEKDLPRGRVQKAVDIEPGRLLPVTRYLEHFDWTHHVCVIRLPEKSNRRAYGDFDGISHGREKADLQQVLGPEGGARKDNKTRLGTTYGSSAEGSQNFDTVSLGWLVHYQPNLC